jgi:hypothetical protein
MITEKIKALDPAKLLVVVIAICWIVNPKAWIADDSYFYLVIARNIAQLDVPTFSGIIPTNGAHPLWMWMLGVWASFLNTISPQWLDSPHYSVFISIACIVLTVFFFLKLANLLDISKDAIVVPLVFTGFFGVLGSESHISLVALCYFCWLAVLSYEQPSFYRLIILGVAATLAALARLDNVFAVLATLFVMGGSYFYKQRSMLFLIPICILTMLLSLYLFSNEVFFGGLMPISGWMKSSFPALTFRGFEWRINPMFQGVSIIWGWFPMIVAIVSLFYAQGVHKKLMLGLVAGVIAKNLYIALFTRSHTIWYWYSTLDIFVVSLALPIFLKTIREKSYFRTTMQFLAVLVSLALSAKALTWSVPKAQEAYRGYEAVINNTAPGDTILVSDYPGYVAFYAPNRHIFAADLLTANRRWYGEMIKQQNALNYIQETCSKAGFPLTHILWNGNKWLVASKDDSSIVYNDPRRHPVEVEIGKMMLPNAPMQIGDTKIWRLTGPQ